MTQVTSLSNITQRGNLARGLQILRQSWQQNKPLTLIGLFSVLMLVGTLVGLLVDPRQVLNEPVWLKPAKFAISFTFYSFTLLWLLSFIQGRKRLISAISWVTAVAAFAELTIIAYQAARGVRSHFNYTTSFDGMLFSIMGGMIMLLGVATLGALILLARQKLPDPAFGLALKWGLLISFIGASLGALMTGPTAEQLQQAEETNSSQYFGAHRYFGAHSVGVSDGGESLPIVGWSTEGGDLRIPHFIGLHAMQVIPLAGWFIVRRRRLLIRQQRWLIWTAGLGYLSLVGLTLWQAMRGQPLIYPDGLTLIALGGLILAVLASLVLALRRTEPIQV